MSTETVKLKNMCVTEMLSCCRAGDDPGSQKRCRFYRPASLAERCMYYRLSFGGHCDNVAAQLEHRRCLTAAALPPEKCSGTRETGAEP